MLLLLWITEEKRRHQYDPFKAKVVLARRLRQETTMTLNWIAQRLKMGAAGSLANLLRDAERRQ